MFANTDLRGVRGLGSRGTSESYFDQTTLITLAGDPPWEFLHAAGIKHELLEFLRDHLAIPEKYYRCFISYSHRDEAFASRLHNALEARGVGCWQDRRRLKPGDDIYEGIAQGIKDSERLLLCCSEASLGSWWVENELSAALRREREHHRETGRRVVYLIPLALDDRLFDAKRRGARMDPLLDRVVADFRGWDEAAEGFEDPFENLLEALAVRGHSEAGRTSPTTKRVKPA